MTYISKTSIPSSSYSVDRRLDVKAGTIKLNAVSIRINAGDSLQKICSKINVKKNCHGVTAEIKTVHGKKIISLSSSKEINILDKNNILNNIGTRIRVNLVQNNLISGLVLTQLANVPKVSCRHILNPYQVPAANDIVDNSSVFVSEQEQIESEPESPLQENISEKSIDVDQKNSSPKILSNPFLSPMQKFHLLRLSNSFQN